MIKKTHMSSKTCILTVRNKKGNIFIAGDRRVSSESGDYNTSPIPKIQNINGVIIAESGDVPSTNLVKAVFNKINPKTFNNLNTPLSLLSYLNNNVVDLLKRRLRNVDINMREVNSNLIVVINDEVFELLINEDVKISFDIVGTPYAIGSGGSYALASWETSKHLNWNVKRRLKLALEVAAKYNNGCDTNIDIIGV